MLSLKKTVRRVFKAILAARHRSTAVRGEKPSASKPHAENYFKHATNWHDDMITHVIVERNRYRVFFLATLGLSLVLGISIAVLSPLKTLIPVVLHQSDAGISYLTVNKPLVFHSSVEQVKSDIARYVVLRESYDPVTYARQEKTLTLFGSPQVNTVLLREQQQKNSVMNQIKNKGYSSVLVRNVQITDSQLTSNELHAINQAIVTFDVSYHSYNNDKTTTVPYQATVSWQYQGMPTDLNAGYLNYSGFTITSYHQQRMIALRSAA